MAPPTPPTSAPAPASAPPTAEEDPSSSPWPQIEQNYFASMRQHHALEDAALAADLAARTDPLRARLVANYNAQAELLRQLQVLRGEYDAAQAELEGVEGEFEEIRKGRERERERVGEERRAWFARFRRGGLAYRGVEGAESTGGGEGERAEEGRGERDEENGGGEEGVHGNGEEGESGKGEGASGNGEVVNGREEKPHGNGRPGDGEAVNGAPKENGEPQRYQPAIPEKETADDQHLANGHEKEQQQEQPADVEYEMPDPDTPANREKIERQSLRATVEEVPDAGEPPYSHRHAEPEEEQSVGVEKSVQASAAAVNGQREELRGVDNPMPDAGAPADDLEQGEAPAAKGNGTATVAIDDDAKMGGVEVGGPGQPQDDLVATASVELPKPNQQASAPAPTADHKGNGTEDVQRAVPDTQPTDTQPAADAQPVPGDQPVPEVEMPDSNEATEARPAEEDIEMADAQALPEDTNGNGHPDAPSQPALSLQTALPALATPKAALSPSSSSELSSRHTTPELDTPVSPFKEPSPPATPEATSELIEVLGESGNLIGRLQASETGNTIMDRILELPVKRPVQIRAGRKFTAEDLEAVPRPYPGDARPFKFLSFFVQAAGELQERPCQDCALNYGPYQGCVVVHGPDFERCGNCEWNKRRCHSSTTERRPSSRHSVSGKSATKSPTKVRASSGSFAAANTASASQRDGEQAGTATGNAGGAGSNETTKKAPRKSLPGSRKAPMPSTPSAGSPQAEGETLPEINKDALVLRDDGVVFTDPPMMRGVPLAKISPEHPYWEPDWKPIEEIVEPLRQKHQERYEQLEKSGTTHRDKHLANRDAKRGRTILKFLEEGELHPYQLVGKQWINYKITNYDALFRLAQLLTEELPRMNLDIKPSEWLRQRLHELYLEKGDKFDVASWIGKAYHDRKIEELRAKNGFARVGRPPAHATKGTEPGSSSKKSTAPRSLKRKEPPHQTPESTPSKPRAVAIKPSPSAGSESAAAAAAPAAAAGGLPKPKKIKIITSQPQPQPQPTGDGEPALVKNPKIILNSPFPPSATAEAPPPPADKDETDDEQPPLDYDGYTSTDSISEDPLHPNDWRLHQVKTRTFATNHHVTQYWHWVTEEKDPRKKNMIEHQVLAETKNKWQVFKKPYNFHLRLPDIAEVSFARGSRKVIVAHKKGRDGRDLGQRGDVMAEFKRPRTKKRFLTFLSREKGIKVAEVPKEFMELKWKALNPETLPGPDSD